MFVLVERGCGSDGRRLAGTFALFFFLLAVIWIGLDWIGFNLLSLHRVQVQRQRNVLGQEPSELAEIEGSKKINTSLHRSLQDGNQNDLETPSRHTLWICLSLAKSICGN